MMTPEQRFQLMQERLKDALNPSHLELIDDSAQHIGHAGAQYGAGHYTLIINSDQFTGKPSIACHRLIYSALGNLMDHEIHALKIQLIKQ